MGVRGEGKYRWRMWVVDEVGLRRWVSEARSWVGSGSVERAGM
jgi:hypothetical protein